MIQAILISKPFKLNLMSNYLTKEKIAAIFAKHAGGENNTGSTEGQIALFTYRISSLSEHLKLTQSFAWLFGQKRFEQISLIDCRFRHSRYA